MEAGHATEGANLFGIHRIWDDDRRRYVSLKSGEALFARFEGLCMGRSWPLYFCQKMFENLVATQRPLGVAGMLRGRTPAPELAPGGRR